MALSKRQRQMFDFIRAYIKENSYPPSVRDIASHFNLASAGGVHKHLRNLEALGYISVGRNVSRSIRILVDEDDNKDEPQPGLGGEQRVFELPLRGKVAAGSPIQYQLDGEYISYPASLLRKPEESYILKVQGDSMIEEYICDGDFVVVEKRNYADSGEMVIAMLNYEEATLKKYFPEKGRVRLQPANFKMDPIYVNPDELTIEGVVVGVLRSYGQ